MASEVALALLLKLRDEATKELGGVKKHLRDITKFVAGLAGYRGLEATISGMVEFSKSTILSAARVQEMNGVLALLGDRVGYTASEMDAFTQAVKAKGIETGVAQSALAQLARYELDLGKATEFARVAQNAAVLSMENSSDAMQGLLDSVMNGNVLMARSHGIIVNYGKAMKDMASSLGKTTSELTEGEQVTARFNAILEAGKNLAGVYSKAMEAPGKQLRSLTRHVTDVKEAMGTAFLGAFGAGIGAVTDFVKEVKVAVSEGGSLHKSLTTIGEAMGTLAENQLPILLNLLLNLAEVAASVTSAFADLMAGSQALSDENREATKALVLQTLAYHEYLEALVDGADAAMLSLPAWQAMRKELHAVQFAAADTSDTLSGRLTKSLNLVRNTAKAATKVLTTEMIESLQSMKSEMDKGFNSVASLMKGHARRMVEMANSYQLDSLRAEVEYNAERAALVAAGAADKIAELDRSFGKEQDMRDLNNEIALIQEKVKHKAELDEQMKAFGKKMALWIAEGVQKGTIEADTAAAMLTGLKKALGAEVALEAETTLKVLELSRVKGKGQIDVLRQVERELYSYIKTLIAASEAEAEFAGAEFAIDWSKYKAMFESAYAGAWQGMDLTTAPREKVGEVTADIASLLDKMLKDIASISATLATRIPDIVTPIQAWLDRLVGVSKAAAGWITARGERIRKFIEWFDKELKPLFEKWAATMKPLADAMSSVKSMSDILAAEQKDINISMSAFMNIVYELSTEAAGWMGEHEKIRAFIEWFDKDLRPLFEKLAASLGPLSDTLSTTTRMLSDLTKVVSYTSGSFSRFMSNLHMLSSAIDYYFHARGEFRIRFEPLAQPIVDYFENLNVSLEPLSGLASKAKAIFDSLSAEFSYTYGSFNTFMVKLFGFFAEVEYYFHARGELRFRFEPFSQEVIDYLDEIAESLRPMEAVLSKARSIFGSLAEEIPTAELSLATLFSRLASLFERLEAVAFPGGLATPAFEVPQEVIDWLEHLSLALSPLALSITSAVGIFKDLAEELEPFDPFKLEALMDAMNRSIVIVMAVFEGVELDTKRLGEIEASAKAVRGVIDAMHGMTAKIRDIHVPEVGKIQTLVDRLAEIMPILGTIPTFPASARESFKNLAEALESTKMIILRLKEINWETIDEILKKAKNRLTILIVGLTDMLTNLMPGVGDLEGVAESFGAAMVNVLEHIHAFWVKAGEPKPIHGLLADFVKAVKSAISSLKTELEGMIAYLGDTGFIAELSKLDWLTPATTLGGDFRTGLVGTITDGLDQVKNMMDPAVANSYPSRIGGLNWRAQGASVGSSLMQGIQDQISSMDLVIHVTVDYSYVGGPGEGGEPY